MNGVQRMKAVDINGIDRIINLKDGTLRPKNFLMIKSAKLKIKKIVMERNKKFNLKNSLHTKYGRRQCCFNQPLANQSMQKRSAKERTI